LIETELNIIAKASFGFGDVNGCIPKNIPSIKNKYEQEETLEQLRDIIKPYINSEEGFENFTGKHGFYRFEYQFG
jgi:hypothetical protein